MNTLGLVAVLLATMTFTAAFTIPGGYNDQGLPILANQTMVDNNHKAIAFQVFMVADVVGMCSAIMVLSCIFWFSSSGKIEEEGSALVDLSIGLLQLSFSATLIAFMSGVYATIIVDLKWVAIFTCALCSVVLVLMRKRFLLDLVVPLHKLLRLILKVSGMLDFISIFCTKVFGFFWKHLTSCYTRCLADCRPRRLPVIQ